MAYSDTVNCPYGELSIRQSGIRRTVLEPGLTQHPAGIDLSLSRHSLGTYLTRNQENITYILIENLKVTKDSLKR